MTTAFVVGSFEVRMLEDVGIKEVSEEVDGRRFLPELRLSLPRRSKS
jgi:hypothetical protein